MVALQSLLKFFFNDCAQHSRVISNGEKSNKNNYLGGATSTRMNKAKNYGDYIEVLIWKLLVMIKLTISNNITYMFIYRL